MLNAGEPGWNKLIILSDKRTAFNGRHSRHTSFCSRTGSRVWEQEEETCWDHAENTMEAPTLNVNEGKEGYIHDVAGRMSGQRTNTWFSLSASDTSCRKAPWCYLIGFGVVLFLSWRPCITGLCQYQTFRISTRTLGSTLLYPPRCQLSGSALDLKTIAWERQGSLGQDLHQLLITQHAAGLHWYRNSESCVLAFAASLARYLCCLYFHSGVGEKKWPRRKEQTDERPPGLLTL